MAHDRWSMTSSMSRRSRSMSTVGTWRHRERSAAADGTWGSNRKQLRDRSAIARHDHEIAGGDPIDDITRAATQLPDARRVHGVSCIPCRTNVKGAGTRPADQIDPCSGVIIAERSGLSLEPTGSIYGVGVGCGRAK